MLDKGSNKWNGKWRYKMQQHFGGATRWMIGKEAAGGPASLEDDRAALLAENQMLHAVIDNFPGGILLYDKNLRLVVCNEKQKALLGYPPALFEFGLPSLEQIFRFNANRGEYGSGDIDAHVRERMRLAALRQPHVFERTRPNGTVLQIRGVPRCLAAAF